jgi:hypothetical protein
MQSIPKQAKWPHINTGDNTMRTLTLSLSFLALLNACNHKANAPEEEIDRSVDIVTMTTPTLPTTGTTDTDLPETAPSLEDLDEDGYYSVESGGDDCNDDNAEINPDSIEIDNDDLDNNCDGQIDECGPGFRRISTIYTAPAGATINWMSLWILEEVGVDDIEDSNVLETPLADVTATVADNVATLLYDRCLIDTALISTNAEFVDASGATHWMCEAATVTGLEVFANGVDISAEIWADVWNSDGACDAAL